MSDRLARRLSGVILASTLSLLAAEPALAQPTEDQQLEQLLDKLGLVELQMLHLERSVRAAGQRGDKAAEQRLARRLADVYANRLLALAGPEQAERRRQLRTRIDQLVQAVPEASTAELAVVMLQADFQRAEQLATEWLGSREEALRTEALQALDMIMPQLTDRQQQLARRVETLSDALDRPNISREEQQRADKQLRETAVLSLRATFLCGWANYYHGLLSGADESLQVARTMFRRLLSLEEDGGELDAQWLTLESPGQARSLIGLGLVETARGELATAGRCFQLLQDASVAPEIRDQAGHWQVQGLLNAGREQQAVEAARRQVEAFEGGAASAGKVGLCATLIRAGYGQGDLGGLGQQRPRQLGRLGLIGLSKLREFKLLRELINKYGVRLDQADGFYLTWIRGQQQRDQADRSRQADDYRQAAATLQEALAESDAPDTGEATARCRNELAWCQYQSRQWRQAADNYQRSSDALRVVGQTDAAAKAAWMAFVSLQKGTAAQPQLKSTAAAALESLQRDFPDHPLADKAAYQLLKLKQGATSDRQALQALLEIGEDDPNYLNAKFDICSLQHRIWREAQGSGGEPAAAAAVVAAVDSFLSAAAGDSDRTRQLKAALLGAQAAAEGRPPQPQAARRLLQAARQAAAGLPETSELVAEYHYRALRSDAGDSKAAAEHANWLRQHAAGGPFETQALMVLAKAADRLLEQAPADQRTRRLQEALDIYERLSTLLGSDPAALADNRNAQVALFKLASYRLQLGRSREAARDMQQLADAEPSSRLFVRGAAQSHYAAGDYEQALGHWRTLLRAAPDGAPQWYEAKYHQLSCLARLHPEQARQVYRQFQLLHPEPHVDWKDRFQQLGEELK